MVELNIKLWSWIIVTIIFLIVIIFFNKCKGGHDMMPLFKGGLTTILYLIFWIIWLVIFN